MFKMVKLNFISAFLTFLKLGVISFGGGAALLPVIKDELVNNKRWMTREDFDFSAVVVTVGPASLPVSLCSTWHNKFSVISAYAYALPGPVIFLTLLTGFSLIGEAGVRFIGFASVGIIAFILLIISSFIGRNYERGIQLGIKTYYLIIMTAAFLLTCGSVIMRLTTVLFGVSPERFYGPVFALSMLDLIMMAFFVIFFMGASTSKIKLGFALAIAGGFALARGRADIISQWDIWIGLTMAVLAVGSIVYDCIFNRKERAPLSIEYRKLKNLLLFALISACLVAIVFAITRNAETWEFSARVALSAVTTFGGGEAYIAVADSVFVQTGFITAEAYYGQIIGISSAMPGPVLMSIAAGIGFIYGSVLGGVFFGWLFGLLAIAVAVAATAFTANLLYVSFGAFKESARLRLLVKYMMPIVCGILISISLTLLNQAGMVLVSTNIHPWLSLGIVVAIFLIMKYLRAKYRVKDIPLLLAGGFITLVGLGVYSYFL